MKFFMQIFLAIHVGLYRLTGGKFGGHMNGGDILLLTTTGRKSGKKRTVPVMYRKDGDDYLVVASKSGAPTHPGWYWNATKGSGPVQIEVSDKTLTVNVTETVGEQRDTYYEMFKQEIDSFKSYEEKAGDRVIPVLKLTPQE